jgi:hypothetical protein
MAHGVLTSFYFLFFFAPQFLAACSFALLENSHGQDERRGVAYTQRDCF